MTRIILAFAFLLMFVAANPVMAIRVAPRDDRPQHGQVSQQAEKPSQPVDSGKAQPQAPVPNTPQRANPPRERQASPPPERRDLKGNDNFIDENHDGIDDRLQRPPEVIKKRENHRERQSEPVKEREIRRERPAEKPADNAPPQRPPERERQHEAAKRTR